MLKLDEKCIGTNEIGWKWNKLESSTVNEKEWPRSIFRALSAAFLLDNIRKWLYLWVSYESLKNVLYGESSFYSSYSKNK